MVYNIAGLHDINTGIMIVTITIAYLKSRSRGICPKLGLAVMIIFFSSILPSPIHGRGIFGMFVLIALYAYLYKLWSEFKTENWEIPILVLIALILNMINIIIGLGLVGKI